MKTFRNHLNKKLEDKDFKKKYIEEKYFTDIAIAIADYRNKRGLSQFELSQRAKITQQQLSKIENGINCNISTLLKVCNALNIKINFKEVASG